MNNSHHNFTQGVCTVNMSIGDFSLCVCVYIYIYIYIYHRHRNQGGPDAGASPVNSDIFKLIVNNRHSVDYMIKFKMASQKRISDYFSTSVSSPCLKWRLMRLYLLIQVMGFMKKKTL